MLAQQRVWQKRGGEGARLNQPKGGWHDGIGPKDGWHDGIGPKDGWHDGRSWDKGMKDESVLMEHHISTIVAGYREERKKMKEKSLGAGKL